MPTSKIDILGSGSTGNCIVIYDSRGKYILLDMGLPFKEVERGINFDLKNCVACFCSHNHSDHNKALSHLISYGIPCYGNSDLCEHYKGCNLISKMVKIDGFKVQTFDLVHNAPNNAFIVDTYDGIRLLYCTDTQYIPKVVKNVNYAIIESNYDYGLIFDNVVIEGGEIKSQPEFHQSLDDCIDYLKKIRNENLKAIILWHLSNTNSDENMFKQRVQEELSFNDVYVADKGVQIDLLKEDF